MLYLAKQAEKSSDIIVRNSTKVEQVILVC